MNDDSEENDLFDSVMMREDKKLKDYMLSKDFLSVNIFIEILMKELI